MAKLLSMDCGDQRWCISDALGWNRSWRNGVPGQCWSDATPSASKPQRSRWAKSVFAHSFTFNSGEAADAAGRTLAIMNKDWTVGMEPEEHPAKGTPRLSGRFQVDGRRWGSRGARIALGSTAALVALAAAVNWAARRIERSHPPMGNFIDVDGVRVHYVDVGEGEPVVLLHGNASMLQRSVSRPPRRARRQASGDRLRPAGLRL